MENEARATIEVSETSVPPCPLQLTTTSDEEVEIRDKKNQWHAKVNEPLKLVVLHLGYLDIVTHIETRASPADRRALKQLLIEYRYVLA